MPGISLLLILLNPNLDWYVGLSGVLHGLAVAAAYNLLTQKHRILSISLLSGLIIKLFLEQSDGSPVSVSAGLIGGQVVVDAHFYGALIGAIVVAVFWMMDLQRCKNHI